MLLPTIRVKEAWNKLKAASKTEVPRDWQKQFQEWLKYHENTWMDNKYCLEDWNRWKQQLATNNLAEIFNCRLSQV